MFRLKCFFFLIEKKNTYLRPGFYVHVSDLEMWAEVFKGQDHPPLSSYLSPGTAAPSWTPCPHPWEDGSKKTSWCGPRRAPRRSADQDGANQPRSGFMMGA